MALIDCPECGVQVSASAAACPACGYPVARKRAIGAVLDGAKRMLAKPPPVQPGQHFLIEPEKAASLTQAMSRTSAPLSLMRINGCGLYMAGFTPFLAVDGRVIGVSLLTFSVVFVPLLPIGLRIVSRDGNEYSFYGKVSAKACSEAFGTGFFWKTYLRSAIKAISVVAVVILAIAILGDR